MLRGTFGAGGRGARHGDRNAQYNLVEMHEQGLGTEKDLRQALHRYGLAAQKCREPKQY